MLDLRLAVDQGILIETPSGDVEIGVLEIEPENEVATIAVIFPDEWDQPEPEPTARKLHDEFVVDVPDGQIRFKVLRFRPQKYGTGNGQVSLGIDAPRDWLVSK